MNKAAGMTKKYKTSRKRPDEIEAEIAKLEEQIKKETERALAKRLQSNVRYRQRLLRNMAEEEEEEERRQAEGKGPGANEKIDGELQTETEESNVDGVEGEQDFNVLDWDQDGECSGKDFDYDSLLNMSDDEFRNWLETTE
ncbi:hypothetical protein H0H93_009714 [Arthromyces matolae]|nr:hypothetical protein H0H93_009714 [Arthromyces matolae]